MTENFGYNNKRLPTKKREYLFEGSQPRLILQGYMARYVATRFCLPPSQYGGENRGRVYYRLTKCLQKDEGFGENCLNQVWYDKNSEKRENI